MPLPSNSTAVFGLLVKPIRKILAKLLPKEVSEVLNSPATRTRLILAADALLVAEAPEARLVPVAIRRALIGRLLDELLGTSEAFEATESSVGGTSALASALPPEAAVTLPAAADLATLGVRGFTVKAAPGVDAAEVQSQLRTMLYGTFDVQPFPSLPDTYTVRLGGAEKPLASEAWQYAQSLLATGKFVYAEPNLAIPVTSSPAPDRAVVESLGPGSWDRKHESTETSFEWSLDRIHAKAFWSHSPGSKGGSVLIGHIDTGYTLHPELKPNLDRSRDFDFWDGDADAQDPLNESFFDRFRAFPVLNPGHGTGTGSVIASPEGKQPSTSGSAWVTGTAPEATLIPYRATPSVVIVPGGSQDEVARAIVAAADAGVDVISMSLGSPWGSGLLREAVEHALGRGVIVCAAAGNIVAEIIQGDRVTYPAKYAGVVAVAGCDFDYVPWTRSCRGVEVDITAPGTDVWHAIATKLLNKAVVDRGSGTSFAVATVAGIAACWIGRHGGRAALRQHYGNNARLIPAAFLLSLKQHVKIPLKNGDPKIFGGGVIDGQTLADLPLPSAQDVQAALAQFTPQPESVSANLESVTPLAANSAAAASLFETWTGQPIDTLSADEVKQFATHVATQPQLLAAWWQAIAGRESNVVLEVATGSTTPSQRALGQTATLGLSHSLAAKLQPAPEAFRAALETARPAAAAVGPLPVLGRTGAGSLANTEASEHRELIRSAARRIIQADPTILTKLKGRVADAESRQITNRLHAMTKPLGLEAVDEGSSEPFALETIVNRFGRPVLLVQGNSVQLEGAEADIWQERLTAAKRALDRVIPAVGRIEVDNYPLSWLGTGWLITEDIVITNRHIAAEFGRRGGTGESRFVFRRGLVDPSKTMAARIDFKEEFGSTAASEFAIEGILHIEDEDGQDMAFLKVTRRGAQNTSLAAPLLLSTNPAMAQQYVATVGYPAADSRVPDQELVKRIFGDVYDVKRFAPGQILKSGSDLVTHDCSTLGGSSASPIFDIATGAVVGLHASGLYLRENRGIPAALLAARLAEVKEGRVFTVPALLPQAGPAVVVSPIAPALGGGGQTVSFQLQVPVQLTIALGQPSLPAAVPVPAAPDLAGAVAQVQALARKHHGVLAVRPGFAFRDEWITDAPAVVVVLRDSAARRDLTLPERVGSFPVEVRDPSLWDFADAGAPLTEGLPRTTYEKPESFSLEPVTARMKVICHLSPDAGWPTLRDFLAGTGERLTIGMYDFTAPHVVEAVKNAVLDRPKELTLVLQAGESLSATGIKKDDIPDAETVQTLRRALRDRFSQVSASVGAGHQFASAYHIKVAVRDGKAFWLSSGNWQSTNQNLKPVDTTSWSALTTLNREWHIIVENTNLAGQFEQFLRYDFENAQADTAPRGGGDEESLQFLVDTEEAVERVPTGEPKYLDPLEIDRDVTVRPLLTPDNYADEVLALIESADEQILFQNQSFSLLYDKFGNDTNDPRFAALADALLEKQRRGIDVRIIIRGEFNPQTPLERLKLRGFDMTRVRLQDHCHTKGIVVDGMRVLVGSHNWTNQGALVNRDASLIFHDTQIAGYFAKAFWFDWKNLARPSTGRPHRVRPADNGDRESIPPTGTRRVSLSELIS